MDNLAHQEYKRLEQLAANEEERVVVNDAWMAALSFEKNEAGEWQKIRHSFGPKCSGFAIDKRNPAKYILSNPGADHCKASLDLCLDIEEKEELSPEEALSHVVKGRAAIILDFKLPLIMLDGFPVCFPEEVEQLQTLEAQILDTGIGLPINSLFFIKYPEKVKRPPKD